MGAKDGGSGRRAGEARPRGKAVRAGKRAAPRPRSPPAKAKQKPAASKRPAAKKPAPRADLGAPIDDFIDRQPPHLRVVLEALRRLVEEAAPDAASSLKWGMPFFTVGGTMMCALGGHKTHVNLVLAGPPDAFADPESRLQGESKNGRHLKLTTLAELPRESVRRWLRVAAALARGGP
jgi:hypothetical protein